MEKTNFVETVKTLSMGLIDDMRGFIADNKRVEVPEDMLHFQIAYQEMLKVPNWEYISGTGQNPIIEYMKEKNAIYITKIKGNKSDEYQRTVGYLTDVFTEEVEYKGKKQPEYEVLRSIALGMGYDVDEYTLQERTESSVKTPVSIINYKGKIDIKRNLQKIEPHRNISNGDKPVFSDDGHLIGFISDGKFVNARHYKRYAEVSSKKDEKPIEFDERTK